VKVQAGLAFGASEPGKQRPTDVCGVAVASLVSHARVVDGDGWAVKQPGLEHLARLAEEVLVAVAQDGVDLPFGDVHTPVEQQLPHDPLGDVGRWLTHTVATPSCSRSYCAATQPNAINHPAKRLAVPTRSVLYACLHASLALAFVRSGAPLEANYSE
jgi:hypothetical protein